MFDFGLSIRCLVMETIHRFHRSSAVRVAGIAIMGMIPACGITAQQARTGVTAGVALATQYPDRFQEGCGDPAALTPSVRIHHRLGRIAGEAGVSGSIQMPPGTYCSADALPLEDGDVVQRFDASQGSLSVSTEARLVLTPASEEGTGLRLIGGGAWYVSRGSPAWIVGAGWRPASRRAALVFDIEYWSVGVAYDMERFRVGGPAEPLGSGRDWQGFLQARAGITIWSR